VNVWALSGFEDRTTNAMSHRIILPLLFVLACAGLARLGVWQLQRAEVKQIRYASFIQAFEQAPVGLDAAVASAPAESYLWRKTNAKGRYLGSHVLLDNRINTGRAGYEVLTPFISESGTVILVNRGWTDVPGSREALPQVGAPSNDVRITGYLGSEPVVGVNFGTDPNRAEHMSPEVLRVQRIDIPSLSELLGHALAPAVVYLDAGEEGGLAIDWILPGDGSARHTAYAVQWFAMSAVLALIGFWNLRRRGPRDV
jgi:surfeit locus 1 family protein